LGSAERLNLPSRLSCQLPGPSERASSSQPKPKRKRHILWIKANLRTKDQSITWENAYGSLDDIENFAKEYAFEIEDKGIILGNPNTKKAFSIPYFTRFSNGYYEQAIRKMKLIPYTLGVHLELTVDPKNFPSLWVCYKRLRHGANKLFLILRKRLKKQNRKFEFVCWIEFTKKGIPHLHIIVFNVARLMDADELREIWQKWYGIGTWVRLERIRHMSRAINYMVKYLTKFMSQEAYEAFKNKHPEKDVINRFSHLALSWALNLRAYSCSRGILDLGKEQFLPNGNGNQEETQGSWIFLGILPWIVAKDIKTYDEAINLLYPYAKI
jgi:hypothetical protein